MSRLRSILVFVAVLAALPLGALPVTVGEPVIAPHLSVQLLNPAAAVHAPGAVELYLSFQLDPGWHIYWKNAGDAGEPPKIVWTLPPGITADSMQFPAPKRLPLGPLMDYGYEGTVLFPLTLHADATVKPGTTAHLAAKVSWIVCQERCIPGHADLALDVPVIGPITGSFAVMGYAVNIPKPLPPTAKATFEPTAEGFRLGVTTGQRETEAVFFPENPDALNNPAPQKFTATDQSFVLELKKGPYLDKPLTELKGVVELSGNRAYEITALPGTVAAPATFMPMLRVAALAFFGGLLLNLMPCVFPVLFLKGLALVNSGAEEKKRLRMHGFVYTAGILVSFWVLVGVLLVLRAAGSSLGWGFQFQSPAFLALMAGLLFFLGLSLAGLFEIGLSLTSAGGALAQKQGFTGSFFTGVLAVIVATPCTAPFMGAAIGYALSASAAVTFAVFTALALGLAAPYVALTLQPAWTRILPRPGRWMEIVKQVVSVPIFATAAWLAWVLGGAYGLVSLLVLLAGFGVLLVAGWLLGRGPGQRTASFAAAGLLLAVVAVDLFLPAHFAAEQQTANTAMYQAWSPEAVSRAQSSGQPVFVDFTASWCLSCQVNERVALAQPQVQRAFAQHKVVLLKADWTRHDEAITQALASMGRSGVPTYALYLPGQTSPRLLPEVLTPGIVLDAVKPLPAR
jgi:thiol:disulfide interchange protein DsbD